MATAATALPPATAPTFVVFMPPDPGRFGAATFLMVLSLEEILNSPPEVLKAPEALNCPTPAQSNGKQFKFASTRYGSQHCPSTLRPELPLHHWFAPNVDWTYPLLTTTSLQLDLEITSLLVTTSNQRHRVII